MTLSRACCRAAVARIACERAASLWTKWPSPPNEPCEWHQGTATVFHEEVCHLKRLSPAQATRNNRHEVETFPADQVQTL